MLNPHFVAGEHSLFGTHESEGEDIWTIFYKKAKANNTDIKAFSWEMPTHLFAPALDIKKNQMYWPIMN